MRCIVWLVWLVLLCFVCVLLSSHPQYEFGVFAILLVICSFLLFYAYRVSEANSFQLTKATIIAAGM